jgi:hypothetical protein
MNKSMSNRAVLPAIADMHISAIELAIDAQYQSAVNCGILAAQAFFTEDDAICLHAHLPACLHHYLHVVRQSCALLELAECIWQQHEQASRDAFCAGYLGRVQQELRQMRPSSQHQHRAAAMH